MKNLMPKNIVRPVISYGNNIFLGKLAGKWNIPERKVAKGESDKDALEMCVREQAGIEISVGSYLGSHHSGSTKCKWYECLTTTNKTILGGDLEEIIWVPKNEVVDRCGQEVTSSWSGGIRAYFVG